MKAFCEFRDSTDYPPVHGLQINSCGQQQAGQYGYTVLRSKGRSDYHLLYVQSGWITAEKDGAPVCISSGGFIFYPPDARQLYAFSKEGNAISYWIHFTGTAIEDALADLPYKRTFCGQVDERMQFESLLHQLSQTHHMRGPAYLRAASTGRKAPNAARSARRRRTSVSISANRCRLRTAQPVCT